jgi:DNA-binding LytR/AlgR family response regulator
LERIIIIEDTGSEDLVSRFLETMKENVHLDSSLENLNGKILVFEKTFSGDLHDRKILVRHSGRISMMKAGEIVRIELVNDKPIIYFEDGFSVVCSGTLDQLEEETAKGFFLRIQANHIINLCHLSKIQLGNQSSVIMADDSEVPVDPEKQSELLNFFEKHLT